MTSRRARREDRAFRAQLLTIVAVLAGRTTGGTRNRGRTETAVRGVRDGCERFVTSVGDSQSFRSLRCALGAFIKMFLCRFILTPSLRGDTLLAS